MDRWTTEPPDSVPDGWLLIIEWLTDEPPRYDIFVSAAPKYIWYPLDGDTRARKYCLVPGSSVDLGCSRCVNSESPCRDCEGFEDAQGRAIMMGDDYSKRVVATPALPIDPEADDHVDMLCAMADLRKRVDALEEWKRKKQIYTEPIGPTDPFRRSLREFQESAPAFRREMGKLIETIKAVEEKKDQR